MSAQACRIGVPCGSRVHAPAPPAAGPLGRQRRGGGPTVPGPGARSPDGTRAATRRSPSTRRPPRCGRGSSRWAGTERAGAHGTASTTGAGAGQSVSSTPSRNASPSATAWRPGPQPAPWTPGRWPRSNRSGSWACTASAICVAGSSTRASHDRRPTPRDSGASCWRSCLVGATAPHRWRLPDLSSSMARRLHQLLGVPAGSLADAGQTVRQHQAQRRAWSAHEARAGVTNSSVTVRR